MVKWFLLGLVLCGGLTACARTNGIALEGQEGAPAQLQVENTSMARRLTLTEAQQQRQDGRLQVAVRLKSDIASTGLMPVACRWSRIAPAGSPCSCMVVSKK